MPARVFHNPKVLAFLCPVFHVQPVVDCFANANVSMFSTPLNPPFLSLFTDIPPLTKHNKLKKLE